MRKELMKLLTLSNYWGDGSGEKFKKDELYLIEEWFVFIESCLNKKITIIKANEVKIVDFELADKGFGFFDLEKNIFFLSYQEKEIDCVINDIDSNNLKEVLSYEN